MMRVALRPGMRVALRPGMRVALRPGMHSTAQHVKLAEQFVIDDYAARERDWIHRRGVTVSTVRGLPRILDLRARVRRCVDCSAPIACMPWRKS